MRIDGELFRVNKNTGIWTSADGSIRLFPQARDVRVFRPAESKWETIRTDEGWVVEGEIYSAWSHTRVGAVRILHARQARSEGKTGEPDGIQ